MASNRKITEFPEIRGGEINEDDLLTIVHIFEVDPSLRNKKTTMSGFKLYLDNYYLNTATGGTIEGNTALFGNLTVTGYGEFDYITVTTSGTFDTIHVTNNANIGGDISGTVISGQNLQIAQGINANTITGTTITGTTAQFSTGTFERVETIGTVTGNLAQFNSYEGGTAVITTSISGATVTGDIAQFTTGTFQDLFVDDDFVIGDDLTISGDLSLSGNFVLEGSGTINQTLHVESGITNSGDISTITITGSGASFDTITGTTVTGSNANFISGTFTDTVSGITFTGTSGNFTNIQAVSGIFTDNLSGLTVTGTSAQFTVVTGISGVFTDHISGGTITGTKVEATTGQFQSGTFTDRLYGQTVTGLTAQFVSGAFSSEVTTDLITGDTAKFNTITGGFANFTTVTGVTFTGDVINSPSGVFTSTISGTTVTGDTVNATVVNAVTLNAANVSFSGVTFSGTQIFQDNVIVQGTGYFEDKVYSSGVILFASGSAAAPSATYINDIGVGLFFEGSGIHSGSIGVAVSGTEKIKLTNSGLIAIYAGDIGYGPAPDYLPISGLHIDGRILISGTTASGLNEIYGETFFYDGIDTTFGSGNASFVDTFIYGNLKMKDGFGAKSLESGRVFFESGNAAKPSASYIYDSGVGLFFEGSGTNSGSIGVAVSGTEKIKINNSGLITIYAGDPEYGPAPDYSIISGLHINGRVFISGAPTLSGFNEIYGDTYFFDDIDTSFGSGNASFGNAFVYGNLKMNDGFGAGSLESGRVFFESGNAEKPSASYIYDSGVGIFFTGSGENNGEINFTTSGTERVKFAHDDTYILNNLRVSGTTNVSGNATFSGDVSTATVLVTTVSGATPAAIISGVVSGNTSGLVVQGPLIILP